MLGDSVIVRVPTDVDATALDAASELKECNIQFKNALLQRMLIFDTDYKNASDLISDLYDQK